MAMTLAMDREPEVARFIDTYKFDQDMATKRDRFGGGTSLPLNSDGYEDKQRALRDERHKDWLVQQDKPKEPVYYRVGTPEQGFPGLGEYERQRQDKNIARQKEYNEMLKKQRQAEQQKQEARRYAPQARPAQPLGPQMDYNAAGELAKAEERKAYQDYMKAKEERYWALRGRPVTPPGGLNIGQYDRQVKEQAPQKKQEYKRMLDEQKYTQLKLRAMDHAADLSSKYVRYREEERPLVGSPRDINPYMQEQQKEHMFLRARQEPEMAVIDRNAQSSQFLANKPPPGPSYGRGRDEAFKTDSLSQTLPEQSRNGQQFSQGEEMVGRPQSPANLPPRSPEKPINPEWLKRPVMDDELPPGVGTPLAFKTNSYANQPPPVPEQGYQRQPDYAPANDYMRQPQSSQQKRDFQGPPFSSDAHRSYRRREDGLDGTYGRPDQTERPRSRRSLDADRKQSPSKRDNAAKQNKVSPRRMKQQLYTDSEEVSLKRREASKERQKEYNDFLKLKNEKRKHESEVFQQQHGGKPAEIVKNPFYSSDDYEKFQKELKKKQEIEYSEFLSKQYQPNKDAQGLPLGQYKYEPMRLHLEAERNKEYNELLEKQKVAHPGRRHEFVDSANGPYGGLFHGLGEHGNRSDDLNRERHREYNEKLEQQYAGRDRPGGRPKWVQESLPNNTDRGRSPMKTQPPTDQYQQMLNEKRREEANMRRYEDPEYQDRLAHGRDRGEAGQRYGY